MLFDYNLYFSTLLYQNLVQRAKKNSRNREQMARLRNATPFCETLFEGSFSNKFAPG